jgi:hypothetical protein
MDDGLKSCACCLLTVLAITSISLFAASFHYVSELQYCLRYNDITKSMDDNVFRNGESGTFFLVVSDRMLCYPKNRERFRLQGPGALKVRSLEGLQVQMELDFEYSFQKDRIRETYDTFGKNYTQEIKIACQSAIHRASASYKALQFLSPDRTLIQEGMLAELNKTLAPLYVTAEVVHLFHVTVAKRFQGWITNIENIKLQQKEAYEKRSLLIAGEQNLYAKSKIDLKKENETIHIDAKRDAVKAQLNQAGDVLAALTAKMVLSQSVGRDRELMQIAVDTNAAIIAVQRVEQITLAKNLKAKKLINFETEILQANADANITITEADGEAQAIVAKGRGEAVAMTYEYAAALSMYKALETSAGFNNTEILRYMWVDLLKKKPGLEMYLDYKKIPLSLEGMSV